MTTYYVYGWNEDNDFLGSVEGFDKEDARRMADMLWPGQVRYLIGLK